MSDDLFDVIFRGDILPGQQLVEVKRNLAQLFKTSDEHIQSLFGSGAVPLKKNLDHTAAERYRTALARAGADVQIAPAGSVKARKPAEKAAVARRPAAGPSLKERLQAQAQSEREGQSAVAAVGSAVPPPADETGSDDDWSVLPSGSELLKPNEKKQVVPVAVNVDHISVRAASGELLDATERVVVEPVQVGNIDFGLGEPGEDLLRDDEKRALVESGVVVPDVELAPVGSDLGEIHGDEPPPPPDTSHLKLV